MLVREAAPGCGLRLVLIGDAALMVLEVLLAAPHRGRHVHLAHVASVIRRMGDL